MTHKKDAITCPKCESTKVETVPHMYKIVKSRNAGAKFILQDAPKHHHLPEAHRKILLKKLTPPVEPTGRLPAGIIAVMAFLLSWLGVGSLVIGKIGEKTYFILSIIFVIIAAVAFFYMINSTLEIFRKQFLRYKENRLRWENGLFCKECDKIFHK